MYCLFYVEQREENEVVIEDADWMLGYKRSKPEQGQHNFYTGSLTVTIYAIYSFLFNSILEFKI